jgi:hypothetical protein
VCSCYDGISSIVVYRFFLITKSWEEPKLIVVQHPIAKLVVVFSLVTGAVVNACVGHFRISELVLSRMLYGELEPNDLAKPMAIMWTWL